jgi:putative tryptophan/tyrosine transport system substrate-binding protein
MKRRAFITLLGAAAAWPLAARAQRRPSKIPRIGIIDDAPIWDHFRQGLRELGYIEGQSVAFEYRSAEGKSDRLAAAASELAHLPVDVIAASGTAAAAAAKQATTTIPIVMLAIGDPVRSGLVASLARPGENITGNTILGPPPNGCSFSKRSFRPSLASPFSGIQTTRRMLPTSKSGKLRQRRWACR